MSDSWLRRKWHSADLALAKARIPLRWLPILIALVALALTWLVPVGAVRPNFGASGKLVQASGSQAANARSPSPSFTSERTATGGSHSGTTAIPESFPVAEPTSPATDPSAATAIGQGSPTSFRTVLDESYGETTPNWPNDRQATAWFADGDYHLFAQQPGQFVAIGAPLAESFTNVIVTGNFRKVGGPPGGGYGLIVRDQGPGPRDGINQVGWYYVLEVGDRGEVGIWRREGDRWVDLVPWTPSAAVRPGSAANELMARAVGQHITFLVNGTEVATVEDPVLREGGVGVFVGGDLNQVVLERFLVQVPN